MTVAFVTNFCPHYRVRTFEILARHLPMHFLFFSGGDEWYWPSRFGVRVGDFQHDYLPGFNLIGTRIVPSLVGRLWMGDYEVIVKCINGRFALPAAYAMARLRRRPFVLWTGVWQRLGTPAHRILHPLTRHIYRSSDAVVVYGDHVRRFLVEEEGVSPDRVFVAHHATDCEPYSRFVSEVERSELREQLQLGSGKAVVLFAGRLEVAKGVHDLVDAFCRIEEDAYLVFVGEGSQRDALRETARKAGREHGVRFVPNVAPGDMLAYYALADLLVLPSRTTATFKEPWGLVVNEAFYQAVPAITTDAVGAAAGGLVEHSVTGLVVPEQDVASLAVALSLLIRDSTLRATLGENARNRIEAWDNDRMVEGFLEAIAYAKSRHRRSS